MKEKQKEKMRRKEWKRRQENERSSRGITLVALVITIVILIILATITINFAFGDGGLIEKAQSSKNMTEEAVKKEHNKMNSLMDEYSNIMAEDSNIPTEPNTNTVEEPEPEPETPTVEDAKDSGETFEEKTTIEDEQGNKIVVPEGFKIADDSGNTVQQGIVIEDVSASTDKNVQGSQYVWIPTGKFTKDDGKESNDIVLGRYTFDEEDGTPQLVQAAYTDTSLVNFTNNIPIIDNDGVYEADEYIEESYYRQGKSDKTNGKNATSYNLANWVYSVKENGGFYIGRYEASYASGGAYIIGDGGAKAASKASKNVWNNILQMDASKVAINTYNDSSSVKSDLINSYAWDTTIVYIQEAGHANYANNTNFLDENYILKTGKVGDEVCKINDIAANTDEWTTESSNSYEANYNLPCVVRLTGFRSSFPAVDGSYISGISDYISFRTTLYIL